MNNNWIQDAIEPTRRKTERPYETAKRITINNIEKYLEDGLKTCEEVQAAYYGFIQANDELLSMCCLVELWIDEYFEEMEE